MAELFNKISWFDRVLALVACSRGGVVAAGSVLVSIYNSMNERRRARSPSSARSGRGGARCSAPWWARRRP
jgi:hypothetical protein